MDTTTLSNQFFTDCQNENLPPNEAQLRSWLWFTCPAHLRIEVRQTIEADKRFGGSTELR